MLIESSISQIDAVTAKNMTKFHGKHPMFLYEVGAVSREASKLLKSSHEIVIIGLGGSTLPLQSLFERHPRFSELRFLDSPDRVRVNEVLSGLEQPVFCVVSKSGETLEIQILLAEVLRRFPDAKILAVTDESRGSLRKLSEEKNWTSLPIPSNIGGRFTHFTPFHRAIAEKWGIDFEALLLRAKMVRDRLKSDARLLEKIFQTFFHPSVRGQVFWHYGLRRKGMAEWMQQVLAESLGKKDKNGKRFGVFSAVLEGPQAQHSVLQLLMDGPQPYAYWFLTPHESKISNDLDRGLWVLAEATFRSFKEKISKEENLTIARSDLETMEDSVDLIATIQAFVEYAAERMNIDAFDQPGVERGKVIARELWNQGA